MAQRPLALTRYSAGRADDVERLRQRVGDLRDEIGRDVLELESRLRTTFDLRRQLSKHPLLFTAVALGGVVLAARIARSLLRGRRPSPKEAPG